MEIYDSVRQIIKTMERTSLPIKDSSIPIGNSTETPKNKMITIESVVDHIVKACEDESYRLGVPVVVAVVDASGSLVYQRRMEQSLGVSIELAPHKAYTAVAFRCSTEKLGNEIKPGSSLYGIQTMVQRPIVLFGGGEPLMCGDYLLGGLGISGGTADEDILIVKAGLRAFQECIKGA